MGHLPHHFDLNFGSELGSNSLHVIGEEPRLREGRLLA